MVQSVEKYKELSKITQKSTNHTGYLTIGNIKRNIFRCDFRYVVTWLMLSCFPPSQKCIMNNFLCQWIVIYMNILNTKSVFNIWTYYIVFNCLFFTSFRLFPLFYYYKENYNDHSGRNCPLLSNVVLSTLVTEP